MTHGELGVIISDDLRMAADLFGFHIYTKTEHAYISKENMPELFRAFGLWLDHKNADHVDAVRDVCESIGATLNTDAAGALDE